MDWKRLDEQGADPIGDFEAAHPVRFAAEGAMRDCAPHSGAVAAATPRFRRRWPAIHGQRLRFIVD
jgi:hypothetical protein